MNYQPNFSDPRVISRIKHAIGFSIGVMSAEEETQWSTRVIDKYFGQQQRPLGKFLRDQLLICINQRYNKDTGECKSYKLNQLGVDYLKERLTKDSKESNWVSQNHNKITTTELYPSVSEVQTPEYDLQLVSALFTKEYHDELVSGEFAYKFKTNRLWHRLQSVKSYYRKHMMTEYGYTYNYDIQACAPTLLLQYSRHLGNDLWLPAIQEYLENRDTIRKQLAQDAEVDIKVVKVLINALFCGAKLGCNPSFALSLLMNHDSVKIEYLKQHEFLKKLREEIKIMWSYIEQEIPRTKKPDKNGRLRLIPVSSRDKWNIYFRLECEVMTSIRKYITDNKLQCFLEHDGWVCKSQIDTEKLTQWVRNDTKFDVKLDLENKITTTTELYPSVSEVGENK
jgi:hypothetical protein